MRTSKPSLLVAIVFLLLLGSSGSLGRAQEATPAAVPADLDLAAMMLTGEHIPASYGTWSYDRASFSPQAVALGWRNDSSAVEEIEATGLKELYEATFGDLLGTGQVRAYISAFGSEAEAELGFALFEDEDRWADLAGYESTVTDLPRVPEAGEAPKEISTGSYIYADGSVIRTADVTFRVGPMLAGVAVEDNGTGPEPDVQLAEDLAIVLAERIALVLAGESPPGVDLSLPGRTLPIQDAWPAHGYVPNGYLSVEAVTAGDAESMLGDSFQSGYTRTVSSSATLERLDFLLPWITVTLLDMGTAEEAVAAMEQMASLARPAPLPPLILGAGTELAMSGVDSARSLRDISGYPAARVAIQVGQFVAYVDVELPEGASMESALAIARDLAEQQAACLASGAPCGPVVIPAALADGATPVASPAASPVP